MMNIDEQGWLSSVRQMVSSNMTPRGTAPSLIVLHSASLPFAEFGNGILEGLFSGRVSADTHPALAHWLAGPVSTHCLIDRRGEITQFVGFLDVAWHAGQSEFRGRSRCNDFSVGIELEGCDYMPYNDAQYVALNGLLASLFASYPIEAVLGHEHISPGRKADPGPLFDWTRVYRKGELCDF